MRHRTDYTLTIDPNYFLKIVVLQEVVLRIVILSAHFLPLLYHYHPQNSSSKRLAAS
jgi:hypothetical protein